jgi:hypothetical protein
MLYVNIQYPTLQAASQGSVKAPLSAVQGEMGCCGGQTGWREVPGSAFLGQGKGGLPKTGNKKLCSRDSQLRKRNASGQPIPYREQQSAGSWN